MAVAMVLAGACGGEPERGAKTFRPVESSLSALEAASAINQKAEALGGALGAPTSGVVTTMNGFASYQAFEQGTIVYSDDWGAVAIANEIMQKWLSLHGRVAATGQDLFDYIGVPIRDSTDTEGRKVGEFERGAVVVRVADASAFTVTGAIYQCWAGATIGWPQADETSLPLGGRKQQFDSGEIYWKASTGAHSVAGALRARWLQLGGTVGVLGYPTTERAAVSVGAGEGAVARFERGAIFESAAGAWEVRGDLLTAYESTHGGPAGWLGFPISGQGTTPTSGGVFNDFENGIIVSHASGPYEGEWAFNGLSLHWGTLQGKGTDCWENICPDLEIYAKTWVTTPAGETYTRFPGSGSWHGGRDIDQTWELTPVVHSDYWVAIRIHGFDDDLVTGDDDAGWVYASYSIDNLFGIMDAGSHHASDGGESYDIWFGTQNPIPFDGSDFVGNLWWSFDNFGTPYLTYGQYAATFSDVAPGEEWWTHPINKLYFEIYSHSAGPGNCFGMGLESIYAETGRSLWAEPIHRFVERTQHGAEPDPADPEEKRLIDSVNIKHGYQLGAASIEWRAAMFLGGLMHDPKAVFLSSRTGHELGDYPLIGLTGNYLWDRAHSVRPYRWDASDPDEWKIFVADPNYPSGKSPQGEKFISIDPDSNTYRYRPNPVDEDGWYEGGQWTGGRMFYDTFAVLADTPQTPAGQINSLLNSGALMLLGSTARTLQISDAEGRTFYAQTPTGSPARWDQLQPAASRIPELARIPLSGTDGADAAPEIYYGKAQEQTYHCSLMPAPGTTAGTPYTWELSTAKLSSHIEIPGTPGVPDLVSAVALGTPQKRVSVGVPLTGTEKEVDWTVAGAVRGRWATLKKLRLAPGQTVTVRLAKAGYELRFENDGPTTTAALVVDAGEGAPIVTVGTITIPGGNEGRFAFDAPISSLSLTGGQPGNEGWSLAPFTVTLSAMDFSGLGIAEQEYGLDGIQWTRYSAPFLYAEEGATSLHFRARDGAGHREVPKTEPFKIDTRAPVLDVWTDTPSYERSSPFVVHVLATDPVPGSGLAGVTATLDGTPVGDGQPVDLLWMGLGPHTLAASTTDVAGWTTSRSQTFTVVASLEGLREAILRLQAIGEIEPGGVAQSLLAHVADAASARAADDRKSTGNRLEALLRELAAQSGRHVTARAAALVEADVRYVIAGLE